ncbi:hypothetical protein FQN54_002265 [Arachnomyces sp. PD_36]|nr:hypothetical protein FQN54_002265 [Arachnomyces sp. PD_36]
MERTDTTTLTSFTLPAPASAIFDFSTPNNISITIPEKSTWLAHDHWHSPDQENCQRLIAKTGKLLVGYHKEPRNSGSMLGSDYKFKPGQWTSWSPNRHQRGGPGETIVTLIVNDEGLERNVCSAVLDAEIFPYLRTTPYWLRGAFYLLRPLPSARQWLLGKMCYIQRQIIYREHGHWEYHGGLNTLTWWYWMHPFDFGDFGDHPAWTVKVEYRSRKIFSKAVQGFYYWMGTLLLGMRGDYPEYNPRHENRVKAG